MHGDEGTSAILATISFMARVCFEDRWSIFAGLFVYKLTTTYMQMTESRAVDGIYEVVMSRRSIRRYKEMPIPDAVLRKVLTAATYAPSAHNRQPWRFVVLRQTNDKHALARSMGGALRADRIADGDDPYLVEQDVQRSFGRIVSAPALILVCLTMEVMDAYPDPLRREYEHLMAVQGVAMATQNLLLTMHAEGIGACWMCAPLFCRDAVRKALRIPSDWEPQALITAGIPAGSGKDRSRIALDEVAQFR
jgi:F420 biosynthesis protein FbiB-like protein